MRLPFRSLAHGRVRFYRIVTVVCAFLSLLFPVTNLHAQYDSGTVVGTIKDPAGSNVPNVSLVLSGVDTGIQSATKSSSSGEYTFTGIAAGRYTISASLTGYQTITTDIFDLNVSDRLRVDIPIKVEGAATTIEVNSGPGAIEKDSSERGIVVSQKEILDLPLNGREYTDLALLAPGVRVSELQTGTVYQVRGSFNVNGLPATYNSYMIDGLDNNVYTSVQPGLTFAAVTPSVDGIQEFRIITSNFPAEYGRAAGAITNVKTKSGTNKTRLVMWEFLRNSVLDAGGSLSNKGIKPLLVQNQFGFSLGGPIRHGKTFYFGDYEGYRQIQWGYNSASLPTADQRSGVFYNESGVAVPLVNPITGASYSDGKVPVSAMSAFSVAVLKALPATTQPGFSTNYVTLRRQQNTRDTGDLRIDHTLNASIQTFLRLTRQANHVFAPGGVGGLAGGGGYGHMHFVTNRLALGYTQVVGYRGVIDVRFGVSRTKAGHFPDNYGVSPNFHDLLGIPYPISRQAGSAGLNYQAVSGFTHFGVANSNPTFQDPFTINPNASYSISQGRHLITAGYEYLYLHTPSQWQSPLYGSDTYNQTFDQGAGAPASSTARNQAYALADFMFGARSEYSLANYHEFIQNMRFHSVYLEDSWRARENLTLNLGLRYEYTFPDFDENNQLANFNPDTNALIVAQPGSSIRRSLIAANRTNFGPRVGFAYSATPKLVWRGAYSISYVQFNRVQHAALENNGPNAISTTVLQTTIPQSGSGVGNAAGQFCPDLSMSLKCFRTTQQGYPASMISPAYFSTLNSEVYYIPTNIPTPYIQAYQTGFQYQIAPKTIFDVAYVGSHALHLLVLGDWNQAPPQSSASSTVSLAARRPIPTYDDINSGLPLGFLKYNSLQTTFRTQIKGLFILNSFTWSQARDNASADNESGHGDGTVINLRNVASDSGVSGYNQPLNDTIAVTWNLPFHFRRKAWNNFLGGWRLTLINTAASGLPVNIVYSPSTVNKVTNMGYAYRPNVAAGSKSILKPKEAWLRDPSGTYIRNVLDSTRLSTPTADVLFGNMPRNSVRFVPRELSNLGLHKLFKLTKKAELDFRAEAFNAINKTNWNTPVVSTSSSQFGQITGALPSRQIQFAIKIYYQ